VFHKTDALLAQAMLSLGAVKGIEFGAGFAAADMTGSEHNDAMGPQGFLSNHAGGILGGITTGEELLFRLAVKPTASIAREQRTIDTAGEPQRIAIEGRHDPCILPRLVPVVEAMTAIVMADLLLQHRALTGRAP
jgi:chorismate synthase